MERKTLYNSLRLNWKRNSIPHAKTWQVQDYRLSPIDDLFQMLADLGILLDRAQFVALADQAETPEELTELLTGKDQEPENEDRIYLLIFELWRRLFPEKQSLTLFCDELDYQMDRYEESGDSEAVEDAITNLQMLLEENQDEGFDPHSLFESISETCAHHLEEFLYDYISIQLEHQNIDYAQELVEAFLPFVLDRKWFELLQAKILSYEDVEESHRVLQQLIKHAQKNADLEFQLELLSYLAQKGEESTFLQFAKHTVNHLEVEEDFQDLVNSCEEFFHFKDDTEKENLMIQILKRRNARAPNQSLSLEDPDVLSLKNLLSSRFLT